MSFGLRASVSRISPVPMRNPCRAAPGTATSTAVCATTRDIPKAVLGTPGPTDAYRAERPSALPAVAMTATEATRIGLVTPLPMSKPAMQQTRAPRNALGTPAPTTAPGAVGHAAPPIVKRVARNIAAIRTYPEDQAPTLVGAGRPESSEPRAKHVCGSGHLARRARARPFRGRNGRDRLLPMERRSWVGRSSSRFETRRGGHLSC